MESDSKSATAGKVLRCKAAICRNPGEPLVIEDIEVDPPKAWEIRIKIICTTLCHTDITYWKMKTGLVAAFPRIFGHEAVGVVESVGEHVEEFIVGDTVLPVFLPNCNECRDCKSQKSNLCTKFQNNYPPNMPRDGTSRFRDMNGIGAAWKVAEVEEGSTVAIFGLGPVGLAVAEGARQRGALKIIAVDLNPEKFDIGKKFGVTDFINPKTCGEKSVSKELTDGGADYCFECIGLASLMQEAFLSSRKELSLDEFISHELSFQEINKAFELHQEGKSLRCIIWMNR
ncbi:hypothetical protein ACB094_10G150800 [Castanea mollissima]